MHADKTVLEATRSPVCQGKHGALRLCSAQQDDRAEDGRPEKGENGIINYS